MKKSINLNIDCPIRHVQFPTGNYRTSEKKKIYIEREAERENAIISTRLTYDQILERKYKTSLLNIFKNLMKKVQRNARLDR